MAQSKLKQKKRKKNPSISVRQSDLKRIKSECSDEAVIRAFTLFFTVLHDKEGYGQKRLQRIFNECEELATSINEGYVSIGNLQKILLDEVKIRFFKGGDDGCE